MLWTNKEIAIRRDSQVSVAPSLCFQIIYLIWKVDLQRSNGLLTKVEWTINIPQIANAPWDNS